MAGAPTFCGIGRLSFFFLSFCTLVPVLLLPSGQAKPEPEPEPEPYKSGEQPHTGQVSWNWKRFYGFASLKCLFFLALVLAQDPRRLHEIWPTPGFRDPGGSGCGRPKTRRDLLRNSLRQPTHRELQVKKKTGHERNSGSG